MWHEIDCLRVARQPPAAPGDTLRWCSAASDTIGSTGAAVKPGRRRGVAFFRRTPRANARSWMNAECGEATGVPCHWPPSAAAVPGRLRSGRHAPFDGRAGVADAVQAHLHPRVSQPAAELFHRGVGCAWPIAFAHEDTCPPAHAKSYATMSARLAAAVAGPQRAATRGRAAPGGHRQAEV